MMEIFQANTSYLVIQDQNDARPFPHIFAISENNEIIKLDLNQLGKRGARIELLVRIFQKHVTDEERYLASTIHYYVRDPGVYQFRILGLVTIPINIQEFLKSGSWSAKGAYSQRDRMAGIDVLATYYVSKS